MTIQNKGSSRLLTKAIPLWDYAAAEKRCPNGLPNGRLMREAAVELV